MAKVKVLFVHAINDDVDTIGIWHNFTGLSSQLSGKLKYLKYSTQ